MQVGVWSPCRYYTELNSHVKLRAGSMNMYRAVFTWLYYRCERQFAFEVGQIELKLLALSRNACTPKINVEKHRYSWQWKSVYRQKYAVDF